jgi:hypothetical protein
LEYSSSIPVTYDTWGYVGIPEIVNRKVAVDSTNVKSIEYYPNGDEEDTGTLFISYKRRDNQPDARYQHFEVPSHIYQELLDSQSKGAYVNTNIKKQYPGEKLS